MSDIGEPCYAVLDDLAEGEVSEPPSLFESEFESGISQCVTDFQSTTPSFYSSLLETVNDYSDGPGFEKLEVQALKFGIDQTLEKIDVKRLKKLKSRALKSEKERNKWPHEYLDGKIEDIDTKRLKKEQGQRRFKKSDDIAPLPPVHASKKKRDQRLLKNSNYVAPSPRGYSSKKQGRRPLKNNDDAPPPPPVLASETGQNSQNLQPMSGNNDPVSSSAIESSMAIGASSPANAVECSTTAAPHPRPGEAYLHLDAQLGSLEAKLEKQRRNLKSTKREISAARYNAADLQDHLLGLSVQNALMAKNGERCRQYMKEASNAEATKILCTSLQNDIENKLRPQIEELKEELARKSNEWAKERETLANKLSEAVAHSESWEFQCGKIGDNLAEFAEELKKRSVRPQDSSVLVEDLRNTIAHLKLNGEKTEQEIENLKQSLCESQKSMAVLSLSNEGLTAKFETSQQEVQDLKHKLGGKERDAKDLESSNEKLRTKVKEIELQLKDQAPLVEIGVDVRSRFMEQESFLHYSEGNTEKEDLRYDIIDKGNAAVYRGNVVADAALLKISGVSKVYEETFQRMYKYRFELADFKKRFGHKFIRAIDLEVTLHAGMESHSESTLKKISHALSIIDKINEMFKNLSRAEFEQNVEVDALLVEAQELMEEVVSSW